MNSPRILVVDDELDIPIFMRDTLQEEGYAVDVANSAEEGIQLVIAGSPSLILLDMKMPQADGYAFIQMYLEATNKPAPIIIMSASTSLLDIDKTYPVVDCLPKPFDLDDLCNLIQKYLEGYPLS